MIAVVQKKGGGNRHARNITLVKRQKKHNDVVRDGVVKIIS